MTTPIQLTLFTLVLFCSSCVLAHEGDHPGVDEQAVGRVLGKLDFPVSTQSAGARAAFEQGMLLLHLFEYPYAEAEFQKAQSLDPGFAMAYWGEAMVHNHPIWDRQDADKARAVLAKFAFTPAARMEKLATQKQRDFFKSLDILYGQAGDETIKARRDLAYERHYARMVDSYPDDHEVQLFYALALMGTHAGVRDIPAYMEAAALSQRVFCANRQHPGAAHYLIHAVDDPIHAPLGLEAARALYKMAPDAGHSLHMTSHIFNALGMWDDVVMANENAVRVSNTMATGRGLPPRRVGHYNFWLLYGLLQQNRIKDAKAMLVAAYEDITARNLAPGDSMILEPDRDPVGSLVQMWARYMLETGGVDTEVAKWRFNVADAFDPRLNILYVRGLQSPDAAVIEKNLETFRQLKTELRTQVMQLPRQAPSDLEYLDRLEVIEKQLQAVLAKAGGNTEAALKYAREASRLEGEMPVAFGPPLVDYPSAQLLGELALENGNFEQAATAFTEQLKRSRNKRQVVEGLRRSGL